MYTGNAIVLIQYII